MLMKEIIDKSSWFSTYDKINPESTNFGLIISSGL